MTSLEEKMAADMAADKLAADKLAADKLAADRAPAATMPPIQGTLAVDKQAAARGIAATKVAVDKQMVADKVVVDNASKAGPTTVVALHTLEIGTPTKPLTIAAGTVFELDAGDPLALLSRGAVGPYVENLDAPEGVSVQPSAGPTVSRE
jgi:hypothetical protein